MIQQYGYDEYELIFLGTIYFKPELIKQVVLPHECLNDRLNRFILSAFKYQYSKSKNMDIASLMLENENKFIGDNSKENFMSRITAIISISSELDIRNFDYYQELLFEHYKDRLLKEAIENYTLKKINSEELIKSIKKIENMSISNSNGTKTADEIKSLIFDVQKNITLKFLKLSITLKLQEHDFAIIAARPGIGKSGFMINLLEDLSKKYKCLLFNMEMSERSVYRRIISVMTGVPIDSLPRPQTDYQREVIEKATEELSKRNLKIFTGIQTIQSIRRTIINEQREEHTIVFIDYFGLIGSAEKHKSLYELATSNVKELREISMNYNCTIILLAQINRGGDDNPQLKDLKETGELEQSATQVIILDAKESEIVVQDVGVKIAKHRDGAKRGIWFTYDKENQQFKEKR